MLADVEWCGIAQEVLNGTGLAPDGDDNSCRWVAVRHAENHIHLVVTMSRQDGGAVNTFHLIRRLGEACQASERRLGLALSAPRDGTAAKAPTRAEIEKAARRVHRQTQPMDRPRHTEQGAASSWHPSEPARRVLHREVRTAVAAAASTDEFVARLRHAGLLVRVRRHDTDPSITVGYAVALPGDRAQGGRPVWFGGGKLASDLAWPRIASRWTTRPTTLPRPSDTPMWGSGLTAEARDVMWRQATSIVASAARQVSTEYTTDPESACDIAHATSDLLCVFARFVERRHGGPISRAADAYDRAAREPFARVPSRTPMGHSLRATARSLAAAGRANSEDVDRIADLLPTLSSLLDTVVLLRDSQNRSAQATAAGVARTHLQVAVSSWSAQGRRNHPPATIHTPPRALSIHSPRTPAPAQPTPRRRLSS
jgi:hypothetical protein